MLREIQGHYITSAYSASSARDKKTDTGNFTATRALHYVSLQKRSIFTILHSLFTSDALVSFPVSLHGLLSSVVAIHQATLAVHVEVRLDAVLCYLLHHGTVAVQTVLETC